MPFSDAVDSRVILTRLRETLAEPGQVGAVQRADEFGPGNDLGRGFLLATDEDDGVG